MFLAKRRYKIWKCVFVKGKEGNFVLKKKKEREKRKEERLPLNPAGFVYAPLI